MRAIWQGERLKVRRKALGLTTAELAQQVGCTRPLISMWEDNKSSPSGHLLIMLGLALNTEPKQFYALEQ